MLTAWRSARGANVIRVRLGKDLRNDLGEVKGTSAKEGGGGFIKVGSLATSAPQVLRAWSCGNFSRIREAMGHLLPAVAVADISARSMRSESSDPTKTKNDNLLMLNAARAVCFADSALQRLDDMTAEQVRAVLDESERITNRPEFKGPHETTLAGFRAALTYINNHCTMRHEIISDEDRKLFLAQDDTPQRTRVSARSRRDRGFQVTT